MRQMKERKAGKGTLGSRGWMSKVLRQKTAECGQVRDGDSRRYQGCDKAECLRPSSCSCQGTAGSLHPEPAEVAGLQVAS